MVEKIASLIKGYNVLTDMNGKHSNMLMDTGIYKMGKDEVEVALDNKKESAFLLLDGKIQIEWQGNKK